MDSGDSEQPEQPPQQGKPKRVRTQAQIDAFERCRAARQARLAEVEAEAKAEEPPAEEPVPEAVAQPAAAEVAPDVLMPQAPPPPVAPPPTQQEDESEEEDDVWMHVDQANSKIEALQQRLDQLEGKNQTLETAFHDHHVRNKLGLHFV
jgi:hypothetical protein